MDSQSQANPWISDRSLGTVGVALQCAEQTGVIGKLSDVVASYRWLSQQRVESGFQSFTDSQLHHEHEQLKGAAVDDGELIQDAYESLTSLKMIALQRQIQRRQKELDEVNLEIQRRLQDRDTEDVTHIDILEQRIAKVNALNSHLEEVIRNKQDLISRLQQPFVNDYIPVDLQYQRYGGELLPKLVPNLSALSTNLENLEWLIKLNATVGDLGGLLSDVSSMLATVQSVVQGVTRLRGVMRHYNQSMTSGLSADDSGIH